MDECSFEMTPKELMGKNYIVRKGNNLINGQFPHMNVMELKIIGLAAAHIKVDSKNFQTVLIPTNQVSRDGVSFEKLKKIADSLMDRKVVLKDTEDTYSAVKLVAKCDITKNTGYFKVDFHPDITEQLLELRRNFTRIPKFVVLQMPTFYALRMYEIFKCHKDFIDSCVSKQGYHPDYIDTEDGKWRLSLYFDLKEFQGMMGISEEYLSSYLDWTQFRINVLKKTQKHFKKHSDFLFEFDGVKEYGRSITHIKFILTPNPKPIQKDLFEAWDAIINPSSTPSVEVPAELITKVPDGQWDTDNGCKQICEEIAAQQNIEAVEWYINFALNYPGGAKSFGKVIRFAFKQRLYDKQQEEIKAIKLAEEEEARAEEKQFLELYRTCGDQTLIDAYRAGNGYAATVWNEGRGAEIEARRNKQAEEERGTQEKDFVRQDQAIKELLESDFDNFVAFANSAQFRVGSQENFKTWIKKYPDSQEITLTARTTLRKAVDAYIEQTTAGKTAFENDPVFQDCLQVARQQIDKITTIPIAKLNVLTMICKVMETARKVEGISDKIFKGMFTAESLREIAIKTLEELPEENKTHGTAQEGIDLSAVSKQLQADEQ